MAVIEILLPKMGESVAEATITKFVVNAGEQTEADEPLVEIATDKVDSEVPAPEDGSLVEWLVQEGDVVAVGQAIAKFEIDGDADAASASASAAATPAPTPAAPAPTPTPAPAPVAAPAPAVVEALLDLFPPKPKCEDPGAVLLAEYAAARCQIAVQGRVSQTTKSDSKFV